MASTNASKRVDRRAPARGRRRWPWAAAVLFVSVAAFAVAFSWRGTPPELLLSIPGQNVLLVTIDTLRADALSCYGGRASTPALDRLASEGVRFDFAHAHAVLTLPSHASILTGEYPFRHGLRRNSGYRLAPGTTTAATLLRQAGYETAAFAAAFPLDSRFGLNVGFDLYDDHLEMPQPPAIGEFSRPKAALGRGRRREWAVNRFAMPERPASAVVPLASTWIAGRSRPWFAWVHLFDPHAPYEPPAPFDAQYAAEPYFGEVAAVDAALSSLFDRLRALPRSTLVIVTGDHGEGLGDHGELGHGIFAYESTLRIPLIMAELGGGKAAGPPRSLEVSSVPARHIDILPTILDAVGQAVPKGLPGRTLLPRRERQPGSTARPTYFEAMSGMLDHGWAPLTGVVVGRDKLIDLPLVERYDLASDRTEQTNIAGRDPTGDRALAAALRAFGPSLPGRAQAPDAETSDALRALGYLSGTAQPKARYTEADDPKNLIQLDNLLHRAVNATAAGRDEEADAMYRDAIARRPDLSIAYRHLALLEWREGKAADAVGVLQGALARGVTDTRVPVQLGEYLTELGHAPQALRLLEPVAADPDADLDALNALGIAYAACGRAGDARSVFERMLRQVPTSSAALENLGVLALAQGDVAGAAADFDRAIAVSPGSSRAYTGAGAAAFARGDRGRAYEAWSRAVELDPDNCDALYSLGMNLTRDGKPDAARPYLQQFLEAAPPSQFAAQRSQVSAALRALR